MAAYWYNVNTGAVELGPDTDSKSDMLGPYATEEEARKAIELAHERTEKWDEEDRKYEEGNNA